MKSIAKAKNYELTEDRIIKEAELRKILKASKFEMERAVASGKSVHYINDYFIFLLGSLTGMRVSELASVRIKDVNENSIIVIGKGSRKRVILLGKKGKTCIEEHLKHKREILRQRTVPHDFLFLNRSDRPYSRFTVNRRFTYWLNRLGLNRSLSFHSVRHYFATYLLNHGFLIHEVQRILGHSNITTTAIYLHFTKQTQERVDAVL